MWGWRNLMKRSKVSLMDLWQSVKLKKSDEMFESFFNGLVTRYKLKMKVDEENVLWVIDILSLSATRDESLRSLTDG